MIMCVVRDDYISQSVRQRTVGPNSTDLPLFYEEVETVKGCMNKKKSRSMRRGGKCLLHVSWPTLIRTYTLFLVHIDFSPHKLWFMALKGPHLYI